MQIIINGKQTAFNGGTVYDYIIQQGLEPRAVIIEYNHSIIPQQDWKNIHLSENDCLEILRFVGGG